MTRLSQSGEKKDQKLNILGTGAVPIVSKSRTMEEDYLCLKWGTLKEWNFNSKECIKLLKEYSEIGSCISAMAQEDTPRQKEIICELIDKGNFKKVFLDWDGKNVSKEKAKKYVMEYKRL